MKIEIFLFFSLSPPNLSVVIFCLRWHRFSDIRIHIIFSRGNSCFLLWTLLYDLQFCYQVYMLLTQNIFIYGYKTFINIAVEVFVMGKLPFFNFLKKYMLRKKGYLWFKKLFNYIFLLWSFKFSALKTESNNKYYL